MALFGPKDLGVPKLTAFYQVDSPGFDHEPSQEEIETSEFFQSEFFQWLVRERLGSIRPPGSPTEWACLGRLIALHGPIKRMMATLHSRGMASAPDFDQFKKIYAGTPLVQIERTLGYHPWSVKKDENGKWIDFRTLQTGSVTKLPYDHNVGEELMKDFLDKAKTPQIFAQCPECQSIYLKINPRAVFCSHRCKNRAMVHRFNAKAAAEKKATGVFA